MAISQATKKKCGTISFAILIALLICGVLGTLIALTVGGGGHPPAGAIILIFFAFGVVCLAPIGVLLGALGNPSMIGISIIGLAGNALLSLLAFGFIAFLR